MDGYDIDESWEAVGRRLRALRIYSGIQNQTIFAKTVRITQGDWSAFEGGKKIPKPQLALRIVHRWGVTTDWIYRGDDRMLPKDIANKVAIILANPDQQESA